MQSPSLLQLFEAGHLSDIQRSRITEDIKTARLRIPTILDDTTNSISLTDTVVNVKPAITFVSYLTSQNSNFYLFTQVTPHILISNTATL
jgi:hypothetical protein